jgi:glycosyltransferase involved in cell wall biosynthesis
MGRVQRGYERLFRDLFELMKNDIDITLLKCEGEITARERIPRHLKLAQKAARLFPFERVAGSEYKEYKADCLAFALMLLPEMIANRFDIIHLIDFPLGHMMKRLRSVLPLRQSVLMTNACCMLPRYYPRVDRIHQLTGPFFDNAILEGVPRDLLSLIPLGIHPDRFARAESREELRRRYGVSQDTFVILSVAALKRVHKRIDQIVSEVQRLKGDFLLWLDGSPEDQQLVAEVHLALGSKCRITLVPSKDVGDLYNLADVMVHGALEEAFGLSIIEALSTGLPVLTHNAPHFEWLTGSREGLVDMSVQGLLAARLQEMIDRPVVDKDAAQQRSGRVRERFDWQSLKPAYIEQYRSLAAV